MLDKIPSYLDAPLITVTASILSIIAAIFTFIQYKGTKRIKKELEQKWRIYEKLQFRNSLCNLIKEINEATNPKKLMIGGKLNKKITQIFSEIRSNSIYNDASISEDIKTCEKKLDALSQGRGNLADLKNALCDLSRAIDKSVKE